MFQNIFVDLTFFMSPSHTFAPVEVLCEPDSQWSSCTFIVWKRADLTSWLLLWASKKLWSHTEHEGDDDKMSAFCHLGLTLAFQLISTLWGDACHLKEVRYLTHLCQSSRVPGRFLRPLVPYVSAFSFSLTFIPSQPCCVLWCLHSDTLFLWGF